MPFDPRTATTTGAPRRLLLGMGDSVRVAVADGGMMVAARTHPSVNVWSLPLKGPAAPAQLTFDAAPKSLPDISPDGRHLSTCRIVAAMTMFLCAILPPAARRRSPPRPCVNHIRCSPLAAHG